MSQGARLITGQQKLSPVGEGGGWGDPGGGNISHIRASPHKTYIIKMNTITTRSSEVLLLCGAAESNCQTVSPPAA